MKIRRAERGDVEFLTVLCRAMHGEAENYRDIPFVADDCALTLLTAIGDPKKQCLFVAEQDGEITGFIGAILCPYMFNFSEKYAIDMSLYVAPDYRGGLAGLRLAQQYEGWAAERGVPPERIKFGQSTASDPKIRAFFEKMGYSVSGYLFQKKESV